jgi:hypothetical protein
MNIFFFVLKNVFLYVFLIHFKNSKNNVSFIENYFEFPGWRFLATYESSGGDIVTFQSGDPANLVRMNCLVRATEQQCSRRWTRQFDRSRGPVVTTFISKILI